MHNNFVTYVKEENKLRKVLINLLGNAIKFTESGWVTLRVQSQNYETPDITILSFEVEDTGPGIAPDEIDMLFKPFGQTETGRKSNEWTGLGWPISQKFVQIMGGEIDIISQVGKGTIVKFPIVVQAADPQEIPAQSIQKRVIALADGQPSYRILVVEDAQENRQVLVCLLSKVGFEVQAAENGLEAITMCAKWQPDWVWMDMRMPVMDGLEATKHIKETIPPHRAPIIIALTADAFEEERSPILAMGCDDFVSKPFRKAVIFDKMDQYLGVRYLYEGSPVEDVSLTSDLQNQPAVPLDRDSLQVMPTTWIEQLHQAVLCTNEPEILALIAEIPEYHGALADLLKGWVRDV